MIESALAYQKAGYSIVPVDPKEKKAKVKWSELQTRKTTIQEVKEWWGKWPDANIGLITGKLNGFSVLDFDWYKLDDKQKADLEDKFPFVATPTSTSPNGGEHRYLEYHPDIPNKSDLLPGLDARNDGGYIIAPPSKNGNGVYAWKEKMRLSDISLRHPPASYIDIIKNNYIYKGNKNITSQNITDITKHHTYYIEGRRDEDLFHAANCLIKGGSDESFARQTLEIITKTLGDEFGSKVVDAKINSVLQRVMKRDINISEEVRNWVTSQEGHFKVTDISHDLTLHHKNQKHAVVMAIKRLVCDKVVEKYGTARGVYRKIDKDCKEIEWWDSDIERSLNVKWFFRLEELIYTMPKSIYVIAGDQDAGKSALCMNMAIMNCKNFYVNYFSSEMAAQELGQRLYLYEFFDLNLFKKKIRFKDRSKNFADVIEPDSINIIDYLEITDNFFRIAQDMTDIRNKLNNGICIIALQKKRGAELGRGAEFSLEKPRLYLSVGTYFPKHSKIPDGNVVKIIKAKNWKNPEVNPNGQYNRFKLYKGINLRSQINQWEHEYD